MTPVSRGSVLRVLTFPSWPRLPLVNEGPALTQDSPALADEGDRESGAGQPTAHDSTRGRTSRKKRPRRPPEPPPLVIGLN